MIYRRDKGLKPPSWTSCFYYRWQCNLLSIFRSMPPDLKVIWKAGPRTSNLEDPMQYKICGKRIRYSTRKLDREIKKCDMVLVDVLSTPMYDAWKANKPVLCIMPDFDADYIRGWLGWLCVLYNTIHFGKIKATIEIFVKDPKNYAIIREKIEKTIDISKV